jgi:ribosomal silencing factor RsfS
MLRLSRYAPRLVQYTQRGRRIDHTGLSYIAITNSIAITPTATAPSTATSPSTTALSLSPTAPSTTAPHLHHYNFQHNLRKTPLTTQHTLHNHIQSTLPVVSHNSSVQVPTHTFSTHATTPAQSSSSASSYSSSPPPSLHSTSTMPATKTSKSKPTKKKRAKSSNTPLTTTSDAKHSRKSSHVVKRRASRRKPINESSSAGAASGSGRKMRTPAAKAPEHLKAYWSSPSEMWEIAINVWENCGSLMRIADAQQGQADAETDLSIDPDANHRLQAVRRTYRRSMYLVHLWRQALLRLTDEQADILHEVDSSKVMHEFISRMFDYNVVSLADDVRAMVDHILQRFPSRCVSLIGTAEEGKAHALLDLHAPMLIDTMMVQRHKSRIQQLQNGWEAQLEAAIEASPQYSARRAAQQPDSIDGRLMADKLGRVSAPDVLLRILNEWNPLGVDSVLASKEAHRLDDVVTSDMLDMDELMSDCPYVSFKDVSAHEMATIANTPLSGRLRRQAQYLFYVERLLSAEDLLSVLRDNRFSASSGLMDAYHDCHLSPWLFTQTRLFQRVESSSIRNYADQHRHGSQGHTQHASVRQYARYDEDGSVSPEPLGLGHWDQFLARTGEEVRRAEPPVELSVPEQRQLEDMHRLEHQRYERQQHWNRLREAKSDVSSLDDVGEFILNQRESGTHRNNPLLSAHDATSLRTDGDRKFSQLYMSWIAPVLRSRGHSAGNTPIAGGSGVDKRSSLAIVTDGLRGEQLQTKDGSSAREAENIAASDADIEMLSRLVHDMAKETPPPTAEDGAADAAADSKRGGKLLLSESALYVRIKRYLKQIDRWPTGQYFGRGPQVVFPPVPHFDQVLKHRFVRRKRMPRVYVKAQTTLGTAEKGASDAAIDVQMVKDNKPFSRSKLHGRVFHRIYYREHRERVLNMRLWRKMKQEQESVEGIAQERVSRLRERNELYRQRSSHQSDRAREEQRGVERLERLLEMVVSRDLAPRQMLLTFTANSQHYSKRQLRKMEREAQRLLVDWNSKTESTGDNMLPSTAYDEPTRSTEVSVPSTDLRARAAGVSSTGLFAPDVVRLLHSTVVESIAVYDVHESLGFTHCMIVAALGRKEDLRSVASTLVRIAKHAGVVPANTPESQLFISGATVAINEASWLCVDLGDVIVHLVERTTRNKAGIEDAIENDLVEKIDFADLQDYSKELWMQGKVSRCSVIVQDV